MRLVLVDNRFQDRGDNGFSIFDVILRIVITSFFFVMD